MISKKAEKARNILLERTCDNCEFHINVNRIYADECIMHNNMSDNICEDWYNRYERSGM